MGNEIESEFHRNLRQACEQTLPGYYEHTETGRRIRFMSIAIDGATLQPSVLFHDVEDDSVTFHGTYESWISKVEIDGQIVEKYRYLGFTALDALLE